MVGAVGGGGLGDLGIRYGYQRFMPEVMAAVVVVLIVLVQAVQSLGDRLARHAQQAPAPRLNTTAVDPITKELTIMSLKNLRPRAPLLLASLALPGSPRRPQVVRIGATPGPHAQILEAVKPIAAKKGIDLKIIEFSDYVVPNAALAAGEIEANSFQNQPYLDNQKSDRGYKIETRRR